MSPVLVAIVVGVLMITLRILLGTSRTSVPERSAAVRRHLAWLDTRPDVPISHAIVQTLLAVVLGIALVLLLDRAGLFDQALRDPATPGLVLAVVVILQIAVVLAVLVIIQARSRAASAREARRP